jgi:hypothetical protein
MSRKRSDYRNELKTRIDDASYDALQIYKHLNAIDSDSAAVARIIRMYLLGAVGTLPASLTQGSAGVGQIGTGVAL